MLRRLGCSGLMSVLRDPLETMICEAIFGLYSLLPCGSCRNPMKRRSCPEAGGDWDVTMAISSAILCRLTGIDFETKDLLGKNITHKEYMEDRKNSTAYLSMVFRTLHNMEELLGRKSLMALSGCGSQLAYHRGSIRDVLVDRFCLQLILDDLRRSIQNGPQKFISNEIMINSVNTLVKDIETITLIPFDRLLKKHLAGVWAYFDKDILVAMRKIANAGDFNNPEDYWFLPTEE